MSAVSNARFRARCSFSGSVPALFLALLSIVISQACGIAGPSRPASFSESDQSGIIQDVPWAFSARKEAGSACLSFSANLPPERAGDPDSTRLSKSRNCTPLDGAIRRGQFQRLVWNQIPGADVSYMFGLALVDNARIEVHFANGKTLIFPVEGGAFVVVYATSDDMESLKLKADNATLKQCHPYGSKDPC